MTKQASIKSEDIDQYTDCDLHQLETTIRILQQNPPTPENKHTIRIVRQAIRSRQRFIKATVMNFEHTNNRHLLIYDSTENFSKLAGHSVLFYALTVADRIHRRYSIKNDTDDYFPSHDGIVSIRSLKQLEAQLAEINILSDPKLTTSELHFYKLPRVYTDEQIAKLRDRSEQDAERITAIILPKSPLPNLYNLILEINRLIYHNCRRASDSFARGTILAEAMLDANEILISYLNFANAKPTSGVIRHQSQHSVQSIFNQDGSAPTSTAAQNLLNLLLYARDLRNLMANVANLRLIHQREIYTMLEKIAEIERYAGREYAKQIQHDRKSNNPDTPET